MFSCERATELMSSSLDQKLFWSQRLGLRIHLFMCKFCSRCWRHLLFLRDAMRKCSERAEEIDFMPGEALSPETCERMKRSLKAHDHH